jgi:nucleoside diphosphate kinase
MKGIDPLTYQTFWDSHVFALICADAVHRGVSHGIVRTLRAAGYEPVAAQVVRSDPEMIDELYSDLIASQWQTWRYRLVDASLGLGPSVALICQYAGRAADPHHALAQVKGHSYPQKAFPDTLRHTFGAINSVLSLIHTSDNASEAAREAAIFGLGADSVDANLDTDRTCREIEHLCVLLDGSRPDTRGFCEVLADARARILLALRPSFPADVREQVSADFPVLEQLGDPAAGDRLARLVGGWAEPRVVQVLSCGFTPQWADRIRMRQVDEVFAALGLQLDPFEHVVLESSLHFPPRIDVPLANAGQATTVALT